MKQKLNGESSEWSCNENAYQHFKRLLQNSMKEIFMIFLLLFTPAVHIKEHDLTQGSLIDTYFIHFECSSSKEGKLLNITIKSWNMSTN